MIYIKEWLKYFDKIFKVEENQINFLSDLSKDVAAPAKYLDVESGSALISRQLADKGFDVTVTDSYNEFISSLNNLRSGDNSTSSLHTFNIHSTDIIRYLGKNYFNVITCFNYRLIFIKDKIQIKKLVFDAGMLLKEGGYLVLDLINFSKFDFSAETIELPVKTGDGVKLYSSIRMDKENAKYLLTQKIVTDSGEEIIEVQDEEVTPISKETFQAIAKDTNFKSIEFYSDYNGTPLKPESDKIICVLKK